MEIRLDNFNEVMSNAHFDIEDIHRVNLNCIVDAGINPRTIDIKYAEQIPLSAPPIILGVIRNDDEFAGKLILIDGNHRMYSLLNVHEVEFCSARIKEYETRAEAILDAYKFNINHGRRLTDKEVAQGIKKTLVFLRGRGVDENNKKQTFDKIAEILNLPKTSVYEYIAWDKVERILGEPIEKIKATKLHFMLKDPENGAKNMKEFYKLNKNLSLRKFTEAVKYFQSTKIITDYEQYKINEALKNDSFDDDITKDKIIKPKTLKEFEEADIDIDDDDDDEFDEQDENDIEENGDENTEEQTDVDKAYTFLPNSNKEFKEGGSIEITKPKINTKTEVKPTPVDDDDRLIQPKGLNRKYAFDTVMFKLLSDLQEDVLTTNSILDNNIDNHLHANRELFEEHKDEFLAILNNVSLIVNKMYNKIEKANKDYNSQR